MVAKQCHRNTESPKVEVGEIDTRAPFQSVKDAVNLFGEGAFSGEKPTIKKAKPRSAERILAKETHLHLAKKELDKLKDQLMCAETTKGEALIELEKARRTVNDLAHKLNEVNLSKDFAVRSVEDAKNRVKQIEETKSGDLPGTYGSRMQDLESARERYAAVFTELDAAKQELRKIRRECNASLGSKLAAISQAKQAEYEAKVNADKVGELFKEIAVIQETAGQVKLASLQTQQEQTKIFAEKDAQNQSYRATLEASTNKLLELKNQLDPQLAQNMEKKLTDTLSGIDALKIQMENAKALDTNSVRTTTLELDGAKQLLQKIKEEEASLQSLVQSLKLELETVKKEHGELKKKELETETIAGNLHVKLRKARSELEATCAEESKLKGVSEEMISTLRQKTLDVQNVQREAEETNSKAEELRKETEATKIELEETEKRLAVALEEAEAAKAAEVSALEQMKTLSERTSGARASTSESGANITISREEFEYLSRKVKESDSLAEMKVAAALAQIEATKASENEAIKRIELMEKEIDEMKTSTNEALKRAEMAEAAKRAVEGELQRWREREQKKADETASLILSQTEKSPKSSSHHNKIQNRIGTPQKDVEIHKFDKEKSHASIKVLLPNLSGIFQRKKNQVEGSSPSHLPDEELG